MDLHVANHDRNSFVQELHHYPQAFIADLSKRLLLALPTDNYRDIQLRLDAYVEEEKAQ